MDVPTKPGDALAQPTRAELFALLGELRRAASTEELADRVGLHPNGVRLHLERMKDAGLLVREPEQTGVRGRPRDLWFISPKAQPGGDPPTAYADLGRWLVRAISTTKTGIRDLETSGRKIGRELAPEGGDASAEERMRGALVALGFQPAVELQPPDRLTYHLRNCPYREAVRERQQVVCGLHRGLTRGLLDAIDPKAKLTGFVPKDPYEAGCLIKLRGPLAAHSAADESDGTPPPQE